MRRQQPIEETAPLTKEISNAPDRPDAVIFAGPKTTLDQSVPENYLNQLTDVNYPVFYMDVSLDPQANPWHDVIGRAVKHLKGYEYTVSRPRDLWYAWTEIVSRMTQVRVEKSKSAALR